MTFKDDLAFAEKQRFKLKDFYSIKAHEGRYVFINKESGDLSEELQNKSIDTILQLTENKEVYIEEKIVRWPGYKYTAFVLETDSCTVEGREKDGWMKYGKFDYLLYGFTLESGKMEIYIMPFKELKKWFWENYKNYPITITRQINKTKCRVVKIIDVKHSVGFKKFYLL